MEYIKRFFIALLAFTVAILVVAIMFPIAFVDYIATGNVDTAEMVFQKIEDIIDPDKE